MVSKILIKLLDLLSKFLREVHFFFLFEGLLKRCFVCRSRGELGSCKDPFTFNATQAEVERGIETIPCASGWCGKIVETENALKEGKLLSIPQILYDYMVVNIST